MEVKFSLCQKCVLIIFLGMTPVSPQKTIRNRYYKSEDICSKTRPLKSLMPLGEWVWPDMHSNVAERHEVSHMTCVGNVIGHLGT